MSSQLWVVRAGKGARYVDEFLTGQYIGIGFAELATDDLSEVTEDELKQRIDGPAMRNYAGQVSNFVYRMEVGDLVVVPRLTAKARDYLVGEVTGPYRHVDPAPPSGHHQRAVKWLGSFPREDLSPEAVNTLGAIQTIFRATAVEAELRSLITQLSPLDAQGASPGAGAPRATPTAITSGAAPATATTTGNPVVAHVQATAHPLPTAQLDIELDARGRARVVSAHPALVMEQTPRHVDPSGDWSGVPGVYVLTGTDLLHAAVRTGVERTLTTTLIVKPWAYVGLSEDFLSRLGSHRQSKPEWRRALLVRSGGTQPFSSDDIKYLEHRIYSVLAETEEVQLAQSVPRGNLSAKPRHPAMLDACADTVVAVLRLTGTLI